MHKASNLKLLDESSDYEHSNRPTLDEVVKNAWERYGENPNTLEWPDPPWKEAKTK